MIPVQRHYRYNQSRQYSQHPPTKTVIGLHTPDIPVHTNTILADLKSSSVSSSVQFPRTEYSGGVVLGSETVARRNKLTCRPV